MQSITSVVALQEAIVTLEDRRREQEQELASRFNLLYDNLKPSNIIKNIFTDLAGAPETQHSVLNTAMALGFGFISRRLLVPSSSGPLRKVIGAVLQLGMIGLVGKNGEAIAAGGFRLLRRFLGDRQTNRAG